MSSGSSGTRSGTTPGGPPTQLIVAGAIILGVAVVMALANGVGGALILVGLAMLGVGAAALIRGRARWALIVRRRTAFAVAGAGLALLFVGAGLSPQPATTASSAASAAAPTTGGFSDQAPVPVATTPAIADTPAAAPTTRQPPPPPAPAMTMTCARQGTVAAPVFGHQITAVAPYTVTIDYGDGDTYRNNDQHLSAIFTHTYQRAGSYTVTAWLTDATGQSTSAGCAYAWVAPAPASTTVPRSPQGAASSGGTTSGSGDDTYTNVDGNTVHDPVTASSAPPGATARCHDGTYSFSQHRSGTCSGHGGVAAWL